MKEIETWSLSIKINGAFRRSPEYATPEEACSNIVPFLKKFRYKYTVVTVVRNVRYISDEGSAAE